MRNILMLVAENVLLPAVKTGESTQELIATVPVWSQALDLVGAIFILAGALFTLIAAIGLVRLPDLFSRTHAAAKPQMLGLMLMCFGLMFIMRNWQWFLICTLVLALQMVAAPVASHLLGRSGYTLGSVYTEYLIVDELEEFEQAKRNSKK